MSGYIVISLSIDGNWQRVDHPDLPSVQRAKRWLREQIAEGYLSPMEHDYYIARILEPDDFKEMTGCTGSKSDETS